jgi:hypothetical chaperone protein
MYTRGYRQKLQALLVEAHEPKLVGRLLTVVDEELGHALMASVEETKIRLSEAESAVTDLSYIDEDLRAVTERTLLEDKVEHKMADLRRAMQGCLQAAQEPADAIDLVVLTGGATSMPAIQRLARETFPNASISEGERMASVALGLAYSALKRYAGGVSLPRTNARRTGVTVDAAG